MTCVRRYVHLGFVIRKKAKNYISEISVEKTMVQRLQIKLLSFIFFAGAVAKIPDFRVPDEELRSFVNELRRLDSGKAGPGQIRLNFQTHTDTRSPVDEARRNLFVHVDQSLLNQDTFVKFRRLLNNYNRQTGIREFETPEERRETDDFFNSVTNTDVMRQLYRFLSRKRHPFAATGRIFRKWLKQLWFGLYSRARGKLDTSGFEHVMVGEIRGQRISGMHNWIQYYTLEKSRKGDYKGYHVKRGNIMAAVKFGWEREWKPSGSFLIGTSPEFDFALNTLCFLTHRGRSDLCKVEIDGCRVYFTSYVITQDGKDYIGSIFPMAGRMNAACRRASAGQES